MLAGAVLGLIGSIIPELFKIWKDRSDKKHEIEMLKLQIEQAEKLAEIRVREAQALATLELDQKAYDFTGAIDYKLTGKSWIDFLGVLGNFLIQITRPLLTFAICGGWLLLKLAMWKKAGGTLDAIPVVWTEMDNKFVAAVIFFWFGGRSFSRAFGRK